MIIGRIGRASRSMLDVGSGDGRRAARIAVAAGIPRIVLLEPSSAMAGPLRPAAELWPIRAQDLQPASISERFDVITCLWNVLGHIRTRSERKRALTAIAHLLSSEGFFFMDVNHRYNARAYGTLATAARWIHDRVLPSETNGDAVARWNSGAEIVSTYGHVFTHREVMEIAHLAGLKLVDRLIVDYTTGEVKRSAISGNLLYIFRRNSRIDSSSAPHTS